MTQTTSATDDSSLKPKAISQKPGDSKTLKRVWPKRERASKSTGCIVAVWVSSCRVCACVCVCVGGLQVFAGARMTCEYLWALASNCRLAVDIGPHVLISWPYKAKSGSHYLAYAFLGGAKRERNWPFNYAISCETHSRK